MAVDQGLRDPVVLTSPDSAHARGPPLVRRSGDGRQRLNLGFKLDALSLMFGLLITGMGLLIILYAHSYLGKNDPVGKFFSTMMLFMASMLGIVLSDNLLLLLVFWELTSLSSFLLIGYWNHRSDARAGARG